VQPAHCSRLNRQRLGDTRIVGRLNAVGTREMTALNGKSTVAIPSRILAIRVNKSVALRG
jgi:hypothetical protein